MATYAAGPDETVRQLRELDENYVASVRAKDVSGIVDGFYAENARLLPPNQPAIQGTHAIKEFYTTILNAGVSEIALNTTHFDVSGDLAYGYGEYRMTLAGTPSNGKYLVVYRRQADGGWKAVEDMFSPNS